MSIKRMDGISQPPRERLLEMLREHCPEVFTEGKVDPAKLTATLGPEVSGERERYGLSWAGKNDCFGHIQEPTTATLRPCREESVDFDATENLFIEGDNLQVLKILQKSYYGRVKMIYIDPPYNTGSDSFIYPDKFQESEADYLRRAGATDEEGNLIRDGFWRKNSRDRGHFHSNWLTMMYPRLFLARNLLKSDGFIVVSIDDAELFNLTIVLNEIFGEENYIATLVWDRNRKNDAKFFSVGHEYMLVYSKNKDYLKDNGIVLRATKEGIDDVKNEFERLRELHQDDWKLVERDLKAFFSNMQDDDPRKPLSRFNKIDAKGPYRDDGNINWPGGGGPRYDVPHPVTKKPCKVPRSGWRYPTKKRMDEMIAKGKIVFGEDENTVPSIRTNLFENSEQVMTSVKYSYAQTAAVKFDELFDGKRVFDNPKHYEDIRAIIEYLTEDGDLILDFFAGTSTTAHAVLEQNNNDFGNRKFICVQIAEPVNEKVATGKSAIKEGFKTIADIGKERIRRAAKKIAEDQNGKLDFEGVKPDLGFKVLKLSESNFKEWRGDVKTGAQLEKQMGLFTDPVKEGAQPEDMLFELILKSGLDLNVPVEVRKYGKKSYYLVDGGTLIVCLEEKTTQALAEKIIAEKPRKVLCLDRGFAGDDQLKTNTALQMEAEGIEFKVI